MSADCNSVVIVPRQACRRHQDRARGIQGAAGIFAPNRRRLVEKGVRNLFGRTLEVIESGLPKRALALVVEWAQQHRDELREDWCLAEMHQALKPIPPPV